MSIKKVFNIIIGIILVLLLIFSVWGLKHQEYYIISLCIILLVLLPFFVIYEREIRLREILMIVVMSGVSIVGRMAFFMFPQIKPMAALVIITGISLGKNAGFAVGAISVFLSNFYFGQGPHTPFQMVAMGTVGFFAGLLFHRSPKKEKQKFICNQKYKWFWKICPVVFYGFFAACFLYGLITDLNTILMIDTKPEFSLVLAVYGAAMPLNFLHGGATAVFLFILYQPVLKRLERVQKKYGLYL